MFVLMRRGAKEPSGRSMRLSGLPAKRTGAKALAFLVVVSTIAAIG
jgi:hypothetical protein